MLMFPRSFFGFALSQLVLSHLHLDPTQLVEEAHEEHGLSLASRDEKFLTLRNVSPKLTRRVRMGEWNHAVAVRETMSDATAEHQSQLQNGEIAELRMELKREIKLRMERREPVLKKLCDEVCC